uniref:Uncharacterized protein n=1 Tax=Timema poppense TaxID=170557 RepID=A0A7R9DS53_TIMPO|nr:unnamed protein product [Timema poppensis]
MTHMWRPRPSAPSQGFEFQPPHKPFTKSNCEYKNSRKVTLRIAGNVMTYFLVVVQFQLADHDNACCNTTSN